MTRKLPQTIKSSLRETTRQETRGPPAAWAGVLAQRQLPGPQHRRQRRTGHSAPSSGHAHPRHQRPNTQKEASCGTARSGRLQGPEHVAVMVVTKKRGKQSTLERNKETSPSATRAVACPPRLQRPCTATAAASPPPPPPHTPHATRRRSPVHTLAHTHTVTHTTHGSG